MQLFITNKFEIKIDQIYIYDEEIIHQLTKVLRCKKWDHLYMQKNNIFWTENFTENLTRYSLEICEIQKSQIITNINKSEEFSESTKKQEKPKISIAISYMNKREKYDRVIQKLWEIWVDEIIFRHADRSTIHEISENKIQRYRKISKEATEQSRWKVQSNIYTIKDIYTHSQKYKHIYIADYKWCELSSLWNLDKNILFIVWPEWGLTESEIAKFEKVWVKKVVLWENILRTETAAIIWWWWLKNL